MYTIVVPGLCAMNNEYTLHACFILHSPTPNSHPHNHLQFNPTYWQGLTAKLTLSNSLDRRDVHKAPVSQLLTANSKSHTHVLTQD